MDYKFGIIKIKNIWNRRRAIGICSCGQHLIGANGWQSKFSCDNCQNEYFVYTQGYSNKRFSIPCLKTIKKDNRGFKVERTNLSVVYDGESVTPVKKNLTRTIEYDIPDKIFKVWREDILEYEYNPKEFNSRNLADVQRRFFTQLDENVFLEFISNDVTRSIFTEIVKKLSYQYGKKDEIFMGLIQFMNSYPHYQILANAGIPDVGRFFPDRRYYDEDEVTDAKGTKPHQILKVPKYFIPYIREDNTFNRTDLNLIQNHIKYVDANRMRKVLDIVKDEGSLSDLARAFEDIIQIHIDYGYTNIEKLILYLFREVRLMQGIASPLNASGYLRDYIRMSTLLNLEHEKYPKSLKKAHDVVEMNYKVINNNTDKTDRFKRAVELVTYRDLAYASDKDNFVIITPLVPKDLVDEGNQLSHCVASYVDDVINSKCKILFLRNKDDKDKPLITIEVRGFNIRQAKGFGNRPVTEEQKEFISKWAKEVDLVENYY